MSGWVKLVKNLWLTETTLTSNNYAALFPLTKNRKRAIKNWTSKKFANIVLKISKIFNIIGNSKSNKYFLESQWEERWVFLFFLDSFSFFRKLSFNVPTDNYYGRTEQKGQKMREKLFSLKSPLDVALVCLQGLIIKIILPSNICKNVHFWSLWS